MGVADLLGEPEKHRANGFNSRHLHTNSEPAKVLAHFHRM